MKLNSLFPASGEKTPAMFDGPIPGENLTSDPKNYPWKRPPDLVEYDDVVEYLEMRLMQPQTLNLVIAYTGAGLPISALVSYMVTSCIGKGKMSVDMAVLASGPLARLISILAADADIDYDLGVEDDYQPLSAVMLKRAMKDDDGVPDEMPEEFSQEETLEEDAGLMALPEGAEASEDEQQAMLGYGPEEELDEEEVL